MTQRSADQVLERPVVSEKSYASMAVGRYVFRCHPYASKVEIKQAVEEAFASQKITVVAGQTSTKSAARESWIWPISTSSLSSHSDV